MILTSDVSFIKGVGPKTAETFKAAGIATVEDLLYFLPRAYEDFSVVTPIAGIAPGRVTVRAKAEQVAARRMRRSMHVTEAVLADSSGKTRAVWFNQPYRVEQLKDNAEVMVSGEYVFQRDRYQLINPSVEKVSELPVQTSRLLPVYREVRGIKSHVFRKVLADLRPLMTMMPEWLPPEIMQEQQLMPLPEALLILHFPTDLQALEKAKERLAFEELFVLLLAGLRNKLENAKLESWQIPFQEAAAKRFVGQLPFTLTGAQKKAAWEILQNFESGTPMNRMLQGDVGSGKTVVAAMAAYLAAESGYQTAVLAPTEILAAQHAKTIADLLTPFHIETALLIGSIKPKAKRMLKEHIAKGAVAVTIGTHALLQEDVAFHKLGFVVIDEQHRFGVAQRQALLQKSKHMPHLLSMTATPIPRSLALTVYGELDISIINERPKGRKPIITKIHSPNSRPQLYKLIDNQLAEGRQAYVVCPSITSKGEEDEVKSVEEEYKRLQASIFKHRRIGMLHGKMKAEEKDSVMQRFAHGEADILISTTVIEVGVDVPNATVMLIESADRFGLAQLHQLRGRVGRSSHQSYCYLVPSTSKQPSQRLRELEKSTDGFYLAEVDLKLRGPGEIYGRAQHGALNLRIASLADTKLIKRARSSAESLLRRNPDLLQYKKLLQKVERYQRLTTLN